MLFRNRFLLGTLLFFSFNSVFAQQLDHVLGQIIVQPSKEYSIEQLVRDYQNFDNKPTQISYENLLLRPMQIYLLSFDYNAINERAFLQQLKSERKIELAQFNHLIHERLEPNDPLFSNQWQYINTGQGGGLVGADIDADLAWEVTTGGLTINGDTIVVCAIDGGVDADHEDLVENLWINHAEIPDNNIDDDENGYVDDYLGWNANQDSDNIDGNNHGTAVCGIIGAKGNNNIGVTGISWDVKMMVVRGGSSIESQVLKAYSYPLVQRLIYNETNGEQGAFVVATNASWGTDFGQAADAPIWCSFYDTLGVAGILNCGATINEDVNVDEMGDLPTTCPSDYMIGVTNMNRSDEKLTSAGYGATHIDLGAFGAETYTTNTGNNYGGFGGTSAATPHVTGAIGLLYAAPCSALASLALNDPKAAALQVKEFLLDGVDFNESLEGITATEGRLNVNNSMQLLLNYCSSCPLPTSLVALNINDVEATLAWIPSEPSVAVNLEYREVGTSNWNLVPNLVSNSYTVDNLLACTEYEFRIETVCNSESSGFTTITSFQTDGCCEAPNTLQILETTENEIQLAWNSVLAATNGYTIRYRNLDTGGNWSLLNANNLNLSLLNLENCSNYEIQIRAICADGPTAYSDSFFVSTRGCGACLDAEYCISMGDDSSEEWIDSLVVGEFINASGNNGGYGDFTDLNPVFLQGETYDLKIVPGFDNMSFYDYYKVWIDFNQDGELDDIIELAFDAGVPFNQTVVDSIHIPIDAPLGNTRMRVSMKWTGLTVDPDEPPTACDDDFDFGEVEDYCIEIVDIIATQNIASIHKIDVFPNPVQNDLFISIDLNENSDTRFQLFNLQGKLIQQENHFLNSGQHQIQLFDVSTLASGIYFLSIKTKQGMLTQKVVKH